MGITFLQGRICNKVIVHYGVSILPWSLQTAAQFELSSSERFDSAPLGTKPITESKSRLKTQDTCPKLLPLRGSTLRPFFLYILWIRYKCDKGITGKPVLCFETFSIRWKKYSQVLFVWLCFSETCTAQLATADSFKAFPLAQDLISRHKDLHRDLLSCSYTVLQ